jgi:hypothetical protein
MLRYSSLIGLIASLVLLAPADTTAQSAEARRLIESALAAAPASIAQGAAVSDLQGNELKSGTNGWTCYPDIPDTPGTDPMCVDAAWAEWVQAWQSRSTPAVGGLGIAYMLSGGSDASNTDPFASAPAPGHDWIDSGAHIMIIVPDIRALSSLPTDHASGGPYVMWQGTPYAHVMVPVAGGR